MSTDTDVIRTGIFSLRYPASEVVVWPGRADWGSTGWFLGTEITPTPAAAGAGYKTMLRTEVFFYGKAEAIAAAEERATDGEHARRD